MAQIGTGATAVVPFTIPMSVYSASLQGGAAVVADSTNKGVKAPGGVAAAGFVGIIANQQAAAGTTSGDRVDVQVEGIATCILKATEAVTFGDELVIAGTDGSLKAYANASMDDCSVVGIAWQTKTAGAANESLMVLLKSYTVHKDNL